jgi:replicative DNA helicase
VNLCTEGDPEKTQEAFDAVSTLATSIASERKVTVAEPIGALLPDTLTRFESYAKGTIPGIKTGIVKLDTILGGWQNGDLVIIAGRPSMGKTSFALCSAMYAATAHQTNVLVFSLEMPKSQLSDRMVCMGASVSLHTVRSGRLPRRDWPKIAESCGPLSNAPIYIDDTAAVSPVDIRSKCQIVKSKFGLSLIIIDYLQLMSVANAGKKYGENRQQEISHISRSLKEIAKEFNVPVVALSQLSRSLESRENKRPQLSDLRESGAIEQDADVVMFVYRDEVYNDNSDKRGTAELIIGKQRNGPIGMVRCAFDSATMVFKNLEESTSENEF